MASMKQLIQSGESVRSHKSIARANAGKCVPLSQFNALDLHMKSRVCGVFRPRLEAFSARMPRFSFWGFSAC